MGQQLQFLWTRNSDRIEQLKLALLAALVCLAAYVVFLWNARTTAFIWSDDLSWEADGLYSYSIKLYTEGRWLVFFWHQLLGIADRKVAYYGVLILWSVACGLVSAATLGGRRPWLTVIGAVALAANPFVSWLLMWPHTVLPMMAILLATLIPLYVFPPGSKGFLAGTGTGAAVNVLSYQLFSLLLIGCAILIVIGRAGLDAETAGAKLVRRLAILIGAGAAGILGGVIAMFTLNYLAFDLFGLADAGWRMTDVPSGLGHVSLAWWNLTKLLTLLDQKVAIALPFLAVTIILGALVWLKHNRRSIRNRLPVSLALALVGIGVAGSTLIIPLVTGIPVPLDRGAPTLWLAIIGASVMLAGSVPDRHLKLLIPAALLAVAISALSATGTYLGRLNADEQDNKLIISHISKDARDALAAMAPGSRTLVLVGDPEIIEGPAGTQKRFIERRFKSALVGELDTVVACRTVSECQLDDAAIRAAAKAPSYPQPGYILPMEAGVIVKLGQIPARMAQANSQ